jgi:lysophospholipase L1-like esterase
MKKQRVQNSQKIKHVLKTCALIACMLASLAPVLATERWAVIGDSLTFMAPATAQRGYPISIEALSVGESRSVGVYAVNSTTTTTHLGYWNNNVRSRGFTHVVVYSGINDVITGVSDATMQSNINEIITEAVADGMTVILCSLTPWKTNVDWTGARQTKTETHNAWLASQANGTTIKFVNLYDALEDQDPGDNDKMDPVYWRSDNDGLHVGEAGALKIAQTIYETAG